MDIQSLYSCFLECSSVTTDTRKIEKDSMFFALKGPNFDANRFAADAIGKGARYAVVDDASVADGKNSLLVSNVLESLQELARHHRRQLTIPVFGLTGSNGKTTTKELLYAVLSQKYKTRATQGNLNNHIGVPLTVLSIDRSIEMAVIEMGANHLGEIALLSDIANPTHGLITNIGKAHVGMFGSFENIVRAKSELYMHLLNTGGKAFINSTDPILSNMSRRFADPVLYPATGDYYRARFVAADPFVRFEADNGELVTTKLIGRYNFENIAAALCVAKFFGVDTTVANGAIAAYSPANMRSQVVKKGTNTIILDAYNANPTSMQAAIENLAAMGAQHPVVILGDMYELGDESEIEHRKLGELLKAHAINDVLLCGKLIQVAATRVPSSHYFATKDALSGYLRAHPFRNSTILIKASRGMGLETLVEDLG